MDIEKDIIQDQKETIHRLQEECKEKTDIIMALEQENAELETVHKQLKQIIESKKSLLEKAIQENAELKEVIKSINKPITFSLDEEVTNKYKQALEEIREYIGTCCHRFSSNHQNLCYGCEYDKEVCDYSIILNKINEVLND